MLLKQNGRFHNIESTKKVEQEFVFCVEHAFQTLQQSRHDSSPFKKKYRNNKLKIDRRLS